MTAPLNPPAGAVDGLRAYYAQRADSYERVYLKPERQADLRALEAALPAAFAGRRVLEVACGTGWWTPHGARDALAWLATDINPETLAVAGRKPLPACVRLAEVDAHRWTGLGTQTFDAAFAGFWWSHLPLQRLAGWLESLHVRLEPGAIVLMLDNRYVEGSSTALSRRDEHGNTYQQRALDDGSLHEVLKNFPGREQALAVLGPRATDPQWTEHGHYWVLRYRLR